MQRIKETLLVSAAILVLSISAVTGLDHFRDEWEASCLESIRQELENHREYFSELEIEAEHYSRISGELLKASGGQRFLPAKWAEGRSSAEQASEDFSQTLDLIIREERRADLDRFQMSNRGRRECSRLLSKLQTQEAAARVMKVLFLARQHSGEPPEDNQFSLNP
jgi:hypothetical protein